MLRIQEHLNAREPKPEATIVWVSLRDLAKRNFDRRAAQIEIRSGSGEGVPVGDYVLNIITTIQLSISISVLLLLQ